MTKARDLANSGTAFATVSATELGHLDGVTSAVQTQIDSKIGSAAAINPTIVDVKGDIIAATAADTVARLAVGANATVLTADSAEATGLKWATPASSLPAFTEIATATLTSGTQYQFTGLGSYNQLFLRWKNVSMTGIGYVFITLNNVSTGGKYEYYGVVNNTTSTTAGFTKEEDSSASNVLNTAYGNNAADLFSGSLQLQACKDTGVRTGTMIAGVSPRADNFMNTAGVLFRGTAAITTLEINGETAFDAGTLALFGSAI